MSDLDPTIDVEQLFALQAPRLRAIVSRSVRTSSANVEDACGFAWLQLVRHRPPGAAAFAWLCTTAIREAVKLHRRTGRAIALDQVAELAVDPMRGLDGRLELMCAGEQVRSARLRRREARAVGLRVAGYSRQQIADLTGDLYRTVDRQLGRAQRKLGDARRRAPDAGS